MKKLIFVVSTLLISLLMLANSAQAIKITVENKTTDPTYSVLTVAVVKTSNKHITIFPTWAQFPQGTPRDLWINYPKYRKNTIDFTIGVTGKFCEFAIEQHYHHNADIQYYWTVKSIPSPYIRCKMKQKDYGADPDMTLLMSDQH